MGIKVVEIKEDILSRNNIGAKKIREDLKAKKVFYLNVMSSPGSGKTTLLIQLVNYLKKDFSVGVIEADIDSQVDAAALAQATGVKTIQMHTGNACHITCQMSEEALAALGTDGLDIVILENIGNLVCPAEFDTGANENLVLLSVPEGDDKPLKYPLMFEVATVVAITKTDVAEVFDFSYERAVSNIHMRNKDVPVFILSAKEGGGVKELAEYIKEKAQRVKEGAV